ncbi:unnamed protein product, partial [marine sediment metagenome]
LTSYGYSPSKARQALRFVAPKYIETHQIGQTLTIGKSGRMTGTSLFEVRQPKIVVQKRLGITTRGAKTLEVKRKFTRYLVTQPDGKGVYAQEFGYEYKELKTNVIPKKGMYIQTTVGGKTRTWKPSKYIGRVEVQKSRVLKGYKPINQKITFKQEAPIRKFRLEDFPKSMRAEMKRVGGFYTQEAPYGHKFKKGFIYMRDTTGLSKKEIAKYYSKKQVTKYLKHEQGHAFASKDRFFEAKAMIKD